MTKKFARNFSIWLTLVTLMASLPSIPGRIFPSWVMGGWITAMAP